VRRTAFTAMIAVSAALLCACSSSSGGTTAGSTGSVTTPPASSSTSGAGTSPTATSTDTGVATALDPCQLVTSAEASSLAGVHFGSGKEEQTGNGKRCTYGAQTRNVFTVEVGQASSVAAATTEWDQAKAEAKAAVAKQLPPGLHATLVTHDVSGIGDRATTLTGRMSLAGQTLGFAGIYALKGATFFAFQDLTVGQAPPSMAHVTAQAQTTAGRIS
jgi:Protein of unknown function (DUF3558)